MGNFTRTHKGIAPMSDEEFKAAAKRHTTLVKEEKERTDKIDAKNEVEAWIFGSRQKLSEDGMELVSTEEERSEISALLESGEDWLWEEGEDVAASVYKSKKKNMTESVKSVFHRFSELSRRAAAVTKFTEVIVDSRERILNWTAREEKRIAENETTWIHKNETDRLTKMVDEAETWLQEKEQELEKAGLFVDPPFTAREVEEQIKPVQAETEYLRYKRKPFSKKKAKRANSSANATNSSKADPANATESGSAENTTSSQDGSKDEL